jgi:hypothetical protein
MNVGRLIVLSTSRLNPLFQCNILDCRNICCLLFYKTCVLCSLQDLCTLIFTITNTAQRQTGRSREAVLLWCFHTFFPRTQSEQLCSLFLHYLDVGKETNSKI